MAPEPVNVNEFKELARQVLPKMYFDYYAGGAEDENTLRENIEAFHRIKLRPRVLVDVSRIDMSTAVLGYKISAPIMIAPTAYHQLAHPEGEVATARAAASCDTVMVLSYMSNCTVEEVASSCNALRFYQLYVNKRRDVSAQLVRRAERNGFKAIVLTVDAPRLGRREADIRNKMVAPQLKNFEGLMSAEVNTDDGSKLEAFARKTFDDSLCWEDLKWLRSVTNLPILIKGVLTHEDARKAVEAGVHGIVVSNHGARQLDHTPATISVLEEIILFAGCKMAHEPVNVNEFQELARQALSKMYYDFYAGGAEDQNTLKENTEAFQRIKIRPRVLVDVSKIDMTRTILGYKISVPILISPVAFQQLAHPEGEVATARAAAAYNTIMILSCRSSCTLEEVASSCNAIRFFQLYVFKRRDVSAKLVQRAERNGYKAIVLTVDTPRIGRREADIRNKMIRPKSKNFEGLISNDTPKDSKIEAFFKKNYDDSLSWEDIGWLRTITTLPILLKGILTREDASKAVAAGVAGIIVSNHGGRQLDYAPATISVLEEVVEAVGGRIPVLVDGGVRRGTDVFKALALGAQAVLIGRPVIYGVAAKGENGVRSVMEMLKNELETTMALSGCPTLDHITRSHVMTHHYSNL